MRINVLPDLRLKPQIFHRMLTGGCYWQYRNRYAFHLFFFYVELNVDLLWSNSLIMLPFTFNSSMHTQEH